MPPTWHFAHSTFEWAPARGNFVFEWSKLAGFQAVVVWQLAHVVGKVPATWFGFVVDL